MLPRISHEYIFSGKLYACMKKQSLSGLHANQFCISGFASAEKKELKEWKQKKVSFPILFSDERSDCILILIVEVVLNIFVLPCALKREDKFSLSII